MECVWRQNINQEARGGVGAMLNGNAGTALQPNFQEFVNISKTLFSL